LPDEERIRGQIDGQQNASIDSHVLTPIPRALCAPSDPSVHACCATRIDRHQGSR
jgi:hypothetical protein